MANAKDWSEVRCIQKELSEGRYKIVPEAKVLRDVVYNGWTGGAARRTFRETREVVEGIIGADDDLHCTIQHRKIIALWRRYVWNGWTGPLWNRAG